MKEHEEVYKSQEQKTWEEAEAALVSIRKAYPFKDGWIEKEATIEKTPDGKFVAVRIQKKIR